MTSPLDQLDETFSAHESLAPDADSVLAKSHEIARTLRRRQWAVRATTGGALAAGLIAGGLTIPSALHHSGHNTAVVDPASGQGDGAAAATGGSQKYTPEQEYAAYFDAGYTYEDAQQLAQLWNVTGDDAIGTVKAEAGGKLLDGQTLEIAPSGTPATPQEKALEAFFNAGYDYQDAQALAQAWHETDISQVKVEAGQKLENGETLPVAPSANAPMSPTDQRDAAAAQAFFDAGYTYDDAVQLAQVWNTADAWHAKVEGGQKIEAGEALPIQPSGTSASDDQRAIDAYFAAGYDYDDAVQLGKAWHETDVSQVKVEAGQKLENGESLPVQPSSAMP